MKSFGQVVEHFFFYIYKKYTMTKNVYNYLRRTSSLTEAILERCMHFFHTAVDLHLDFLCARLACVVPHLSEQWLELCEKVCTKKKRCIYISKLLFQCAEKHHLNKCTTWLKLYVKYGGQWFNYTLWVGLFMTIIMVNGW